ncbi:hypothetical protein CDD81_3629 [Ophiocordyceps australis]|uniref:CN hydrolase domain-containing protein n=1 Tax=Ophiocordyceps australis TaxID=1399860 RepID=A0A2C5YCK1_9HYPO|nr:hypothetical protein CDD81_3629 [Ophiocordyceps australis]
MRIGCLQFAPRVGDVGGNIKRADAVMSRANSEDLSLDLLVLPEMAMTGYNFKTLQDVEPFLEDKDSGASCAWARAAAAKYKCVVVAGYPEKVHGPSASSMETERYNAAIVVDGERVTNCRKSFLYYTDEAWALEGQGFYHGTISSLGIKTSIGICMDINPYKFEAPWTAFEFAFEVLQVKSNLVILSMAWLTRDEADVFLETPSQPDTNTLIYWVNRFEPLIRSNKDDEVVVVFANRSGTEDEATYAGTSTVIGVQNGQVKVYGLLGRGDEELLVVDTSCPPCAWIRHAMTPVEQNSSS